MYRKDFGNCLHLHQDRSKRYNIESIPAVHSHSSIIEWYLDLTVERNSPKTHFSAKTGFVSRFQEAGSESTMHFNRRGDDVGGSACGRYLCASVVKHREKLRTLI